VSCGSGCSSRRGRVGCRAAMMSVVLPPLTCLAPVSHHHHNTYHSEPVSRVSSARSLSPPQYHPLLLPPPVSLSPLTDGNSQLPCHRISYPAPMIPICIPPLQPSHLPHRATLHPTSQAAVDVGSVLLCLSSHFPSQPRRDLNTGGEQVPQPIPYPPLPPLNAHLR
jgi:hypothetical protein